MLSVAGLRLPPKPGIYSRAFTQNFFSGQRRLVGPRPAAAAGSRRTSRVISNNAPVRSRGHQIADVSLACPGPFPLLQAESNAKADLVSLRDSVIQNREFLESSAKQPLLVRHVDRRSLIMQVRGLSPGNPCFERGGECLSSGGWIRRRGRRPLPETADRVATSQQPDQQEGESRPTPAPCFATSIHPQPPHLCEFRVLARQPGRSSPRRNGPSHHRVTCSRHPDDCFEPKWQSALEETCRSGYWED